MLNKDKRISHTKKHVLMLLCLNNNTRMVTFSPHVFYARKI